MIRGLGALVAVSLGCAGSGAATAPPMSPLEARYRLAVSGAEPLDDPRTAGRAAREVVATGVYRQVLARSLFSRCKMIPSDSRAFDLRARSCGAPRNVTTATARLLLESAASSRFLRATVHAGRFGWVDLPASCAP